jgi:hypothetical protein
MRVVSKPSSSAFGSARKALPRNSIPAPDEVQPFGRYGAGLLTEHPVGLVVVAAVILLTLCGIPETWWFFVASLILGGLFGFFLWLYHRQVKSGPFRHKMSHFIAPRI